MDFPRIIRLLLVFYLLSANRVTPTMTTGSAVKQPDQPFWQYVLREFVFRTISSPVSNNALYKKLLEAPFYGGPLSEATNGGTPFLSRGSVYRTPDRQWIFCQDDCEKCGLCADQKSPIVKWSLRKVKRWTSKGLANWHQQLTVLPQQDTISQSGLLTRQWPDNYAYVIREDEPSRGDTEVSLTSDGALVNQKPRGKIVWVSSKMKSRQGIPHMDQSDWTFQSNGNGDSKKNSTNMTPENSQGHSGFIGTRNVARSRRRRWKDKPIERPGQLAFHYPQENNSRMKNPTGTLHDDENPRLIAGIDQFGEKHLIHVVPIFPALRNPRQFGDLSSYRGSSRTINPPRISRTIHPVSAKPAYDRLIDRIIDSLNTHRNFVETFMFPEKLEPKTLKDPASFSYPPYSGATNGGRRLQNRNDDAAYHGPSSHQPNHEPTDTEHQVEEDEQLYRRYGDMTGEVNRPAGVYQDHSSMIGYEPYGMSANDQRHDERSSPRADAECRRRNSRGKPTYTSSTFGHQGAGENRTQVRNTHSVLAIERKFAENPDNQGPGNSQLKINQTDLPIQNSSVATTTVEAPAGE